MKVTTDKNFEIINVKSFCCRRKERYSLSVVIFYPPYKRFKLKRCYQIQRMSVESCSLIRWKISVDSYLLKWIINYTTNFFNLARWYLKRSVSRDISGLFWHVWTDLRRNKDLRKTIRDLMLILYPRIYTDAQHDNS